MARTILIVDDDTVLGEQIADVLQRPDRRIILCSDFEAASVVLGRVPVSLVLTDLRLSPPYGYDGLKLLHKANECQPDATVIAMTGQIDGVLEQSARGQGAGLVLLKPFGAGEIETLVEASCEVEIPTFLEGASEPVRFPEFEREMVERDFVAVFQPLVELRSSSIAGAEALARNRRPLPFHDILSAIEYAERRGTMAELDLSLIGGSLRQGAEWARTAPLFLNIHPATLSKPDRLIPRIVLEAERYRIPLGNLVIEITEHAALPGNPIAIGCINELRDAGIRFALDDVGVAYSHLGLIDRIQPSFLKISQDFGTDFERHTMRGRLVRNISSLATDFGIDVILEGVETAETAEAARSIGIRYGQGYYFARPGAVSQLFESVAA